MRGYNWSSATRVIAAKAEIAFDHPVFTEFPVMETNYAYDDFCQHLYRDGSAYKVRQYALLKASGEIHSASITLSSGGNTLERFFSSFCNLPAETPLTAGHIDIASGFGYVMTIPTETLYLALNGKVYYRSGSSWTQLADLRDTINNVTPIITLVGLDHTRVAAAAVYSGETVYDHCELSVIDRTTVDTWKGHLPKTSARVGLAAVIESDMTTHFYVDNWNGKKPVHVKRYYSGVWSAAEPILPMDNLDEESSFTVGFASKLYGWNGRIFLTGTLKRQYGTTFGIYMQGPDKFTFGRDLILCGDPTGPFQIFKPDNNAIWAVGFGNKCYYSDFTGIFQDDPAQDEVLATAGVHSFNADFGVNQSGRISLDVPASFLESHVGDAKPGARLDLKISDSGGQYYNKLGTFGIDRVVKQVTADGDSYTIDCSAAAMKKLMDWESDTYFDYLAQGEVHGDPGDLTRLIRFSGSRFDTPDAGNGLRLESLNDDGMLYTTPSASHGGFIKGKFTNLQTTNTMVGVGLNYGEETLAEAAERLGKKIENTTGNDRARYGLFVIYYPDPIGASGGQIWLADYNTVRKGYGGDAAITNAWRVIQKVDVTRPVPNGTAVLAMQYQDGYARAYYASSDSPSLTQVISTQAFLDGEIHPAEHDNYGRGAIYLRNNTGAHMSFPMSSDCDVIPLRSLAEKYAEVGVPLEDRADKFPASNGAVLVDSEQILYTGIAGWRNYNGADRRTLDLEWVPGEILANAGDGISSPTGANTDFARSRGTRDQTPHVHGNNYVLQSLDIPAGRTITAMRVWLKKINFPEDTVTLTINSGRTTTSADATNLVNFVVSSAQMGPGSKITEEGGWVTFFLDQDVKIASLPAGDKYWIMLRRSKNWNHPSSYSYFQYKKMANTTYSGGSCYVFCEEDDAVVSQSGDIAFVVYGKVEGVNKEFCIPVRHEADHGLSDAENFFAGCAVTVTDGQGKNNCYRIIRSRHYNDGGANNLYLFFVDRSPGAIFDVGTMVRAVPALYGLKRGRNATYPASHGGNSLVHIPASQYALALDFEYFTANEDKTLAEVAEDLARKAGVLSTNMCNRGAAYSTPATSQNMIAVLTIPSLSTGEVVTCTFAGVDVNVAMALRQTAAATGQITITHLENAVQTTILDIAADEPFWGSARLSLYDGRLSLWISGRLVVSAVMPQITWSKFSVSCANVSKTPTVFVPQAGTRVDNFVMDMGKTGAQLLQNLIGEKRVYFQDTIDGELKIFTDREDQMEALENFVAIVTEKTDVGLATRVLLEGGEVVEVSSAGNIAQYGNFFKTFNFSEINSLADAQYFAGMVMEDMVLNRERVEITASVDPGIEPTDNLILIMPDATQQRVVVDAVSHTMRLDDVEAVYDMRIAGRYAPPVEEE